MLIKVTLLKNSKTHLVNIMHIIDVYDDNGETLVFLTGESNTVRVKETLDEIYDLCNS